MSPARLNAAAAAAAAYDDLSRSSVWCAQYGILNMPPNKAEVRA